MDELISLSTDIGFPEKLRVTVKLTLRDLEAGRDLHIFFYSLFMNCQVLFESTTVHFLY